MMHRDVSKIMSKFDHDSDWSYSSIPDVDEYMKKNEAKYLAEKTASPARWRWKLRMVNLSASFYFFFFTILSMLIGIQITLPDLYESDNNLLQRRIILAVFIFISMFVNYTLIFISSRKSKIGLCNQVLPSSQQNWSKCNHCDIMVPPRAKHCVLCNCCVLKRDHHCFFSGCCIGFHNQRYFIIFCFYGTLGAMFSLYATYNYLTKYYTVFLSSDFYGYLLPWVIWRWLFGNISFSITFLVIWLYLSFGTTCACCYFFMWQIFLLFTGQTTYEFLKKDKTYRQPFFENLRTVFGRFSLLNFLLPMPWFKNKGSGYEWKTRCSLYEKVY